MPQPEGPATRITSCRFCGGALSIPFCDLGATPLANAYVAPEHAGTPDPVFPLNAVVCERCFLVQLDHVVDAGAIFSDYAYFSSYSSTWLAHAASFARAATARFALGPQSFVVEVASNDGYLLRNFVAAGIPCLGIEPAANVAQAAATAGVQTQVAFFGRACARDLVAQRGHADLVIANNVLAHVPDVNDFVAGLALLAGPRGTVSIEAPHLLALIEQGQFDTIYHEHYAYWSLHAMRQVLGAHGLTVYGVEVLPTHGTSLRVLASADPEPARLHVPPAQSGPPRRDGTDGRHKAGHDMGAATACSPVDHLAEVQAAEARAGLGTPAPYRGFQPLVQATIDGIRAWLGEARAAGRRVAAYGAAAKGNTFLNASGVTAAEIGLVADRSPAKQGRLLPGSRIPVVSPDELLAWRPDDVLILPWNIAPEIAAELLAVRSWGGRLLTAVPQMREWA